MGEDVNPGFCIVHMELYKDASNVSLFYKTLNTVPSFHPSLFYAPIQGHGGMVYLHRSPLFGQSSEYYSEFLSAVKGSESYVCCFQTKTI